MNTKMQYVYIHKETYLHNKYIFICGCVGGSVNEGRGLWRSQEGIIEALWKALKENLTLVL